MKNLYKQIEQSYLKRCNNHKLQKKYWNKIAKDLSPGNLLQNPRPSLQLTQLSGDLGISLMWIVQSTLIRNFISNIHVELIESDSKSKISSTITKILKNEKLMGALAHSEDSNNPVILSPDKNNKLLHLTGTKKYITGGINADFILLTARKSKNEKINNLLYLENNNKLKKSLKNLDLNYLKTSCHGKLEMCPITISNDSIIPISEKNLRRQLKIWSIIERSLILESLLGFLVYLYEKILQMYEQEITDVVELKKLLSIQKNIVDKQVQAVLKNEKIKEGFSDIIKIFNILNNYNKFYEDERNTMTEDFKTRFMDLKFLENMKKS